MTHRFVHIGINFGEMLKTEELEPVLQAVSDDWIRYAPNNWIVWSNSTNADIAAALRRNLTLNDQFMLFEINPQNRDGWHQQWVWEWLSKLRLPPPSPSALGTFDWTAALAASKLLPKA